MAEQQDPNPETPEDEGAASTPFDSPWFLPVLLWPLSAWFGYDGWFNPEIESITFNRVGFGLLLAGAVWTTFQAYRETREPGSEGES